MTGFAATAGTRTRRSYLEVPSQPSAVPEARRWIRARLARWGLGAVANDAELIIAELASNAITASAAMPFPAHVGLLVAADRAGLALLVWDASPEPPVQKPADDDALCGRGLQLVAALSERWGHTVDDRQRGKVVYAVLALNHS